MDSVNWVLDDYLVMPSGSVDVSLSSSEVDSPAERDDASDAERNARVTRVNAGEKRTRRKKRPSAKPGECAVCGDESSGHHHYDVPSCHSCKIFFRRTIMKQAEYRCLRKKKCEDSESPKEFLSCRYCRFKKCVEAGMNPMSIISREELANNKVVQKILEQRAVENERTAVSTENRIAIPAEPITAPVRCTELRVVRMLDLLCYLEERHEAVRRSVYCPRSDSDIGLEDVLNMPCSLGMNYQEMEGWPLVNDASNYDLHLPLDLHLKYRIFVSRPSHYTQYQNIKEWLYVDMIYAIDYAKAFGILDKLDHIDQLRLLRSVAVKVSCITSGYFSYKNKSLLAYYPDGRTPYRKHEIGTKNRWLVPIYLWNIQIDRQMYLLMKAIILCDPGVEELSARACRVLTAEREKYATILMRYLLASYGAQDGPRMFVDCLKFLEASHVQMEKLREIDNLLVALDLKARSRLGMELGGVH